MYKLVVLCLFVSYLVAIQAWPRVVRSQGWYQCCCAEENPDCPVGCFLCRNYVYSCECSTCSCYSSDETRPSVTDIRTHPTKDLLQLLLRSGFGGGRFKRDDHGKDDVISDVGNDVGIEMSTE